MQSTRIISVCLFTFCLKLVQCQSEGQPCTLQATGQPGTCTLLTKCPSAIVLLQQRVPPQICGFQQGSTATIVCCSSGTPIVPATTTSRTTTSTRATVTTRRIIPAVVTTPSTTTTTRRLTGAVGEKSLLKCREYGQYVYVSQVQTAFIDDPESRKNCVQDAETLIVGGKAALPKEFPHMALLGFDGPEGVLYKCGGSLISEFFILTAAHCLYDRETSSYVKHIRLGEYDIASTRDDAKPQNLLVAEIIRHPNYKPPSKYNDIALLRMGTRATFNAYVRPACLHTEREVGRKFVVATGWGKTEYAGSSSNVLMKVLLDVYTNQQCNSSYETNREIVSGILDSQVCAGSFTEAKDACQGDSGGPLQISNTNRVYCTYNVVGVTSFGKACGVINQPGVYTRVFNYLGWIEPIVWP